MIDFKYHMVSLVAVFLALAVGIVLGAGPLRGELSDTLESQVAELGQERNVLRSQVDLQQRRADGKDRLLNASVPRAVQGTLTDQRVRVVELPGAEDGVADDLASTSVQAGAEEVTRATVLEGWEDPRAEADRQAAADGLLAAFPDHDAAQASTTAALLAHVLAGPTSRDATQPWQEALAGLIDLDAIETIEPIETGLVLPGVPISATPDVVILVTGGINAGNLRDEPDAQLVLEQRLALISELAQENVPTLVVGTGAETFAEQPADVEAPLVTAIRSDEDLADVVTTVDNAESPAGRLAATWAAAWLLTGDQGHYGLAADAEAPAPDSPPSAGDAETPSSLQAPDPALDLAPPTQGEQGDQ